MKFHDLIRRAAGRLTKRRPVRHGWNALNIDGSPRTLIDVGCAYDSHEFRTPFPDARLLALDPIREYEPHMREAVRQRGGSYEIVAVGASNGQIELTVNCDDFEKSSLYERSKLTARDAVHEVRTVPVKTLDDLVRAHSAEPPFGLKIDTEGNELDVLRGARATLGDCAFVITEASVQQRFHGSYELFELHEFLHEAGFKVGNILSAEPDHNGLVRFMDLLFVPRSR